MRHKVDINKLGKPTNQRIAMLKGLVTQLFLHGKIKTTEARAKATKRIAERTLTTAKKNDLTAKRTVRKTVNDKVAFKKIFEEYVPRYAETPGGYLSIVKLPPRRGDASAMALLTFVNKD